MTVKKIFKNTVLYFLLALILSLLFTFWYKSNKRNKELALTDCVYSLKQIKRALNSYKGEYGVFPPYQSDRTFQVLIEQKFIYSREFIHRQNKKFGYHYNYDLVSKNGLYKDVNAIVWDNLDNHEKVVHALFISGEVKSFTKQEWESFLHNPTPPSLKVK